MNCQNLQTAIVCKLQEFTFRMLKLQLYYSFNIRNIL